MQESGQEGKNLRMVGDVSPEGQLHFSKTGALCSFYVEKGCLMIGFEV